MMLLLMIMIMLQMNYGCIFYAASGKLRVLNEGGRSKVFVAQKNSFDLFNDSEVYGRYVIRRITL